MGTRGHASSLGWGKILQERDKFGGMCLVIGGDFVWVKLVCGVMQKIAVGVVCYFSPVLEWHIGDAQTN